MNSALHAVAAADGSWCTPFEYILVDSSSEGLALFKQDSITIMTPDGEIQCIWMVDDIGITAERFNRLLGEIFYVEGIAGARRGDYFAIDWAPEGSPNIWAFNLVTGELKVLTQEEWNEIPEDEYEDLPEQETAIPNAEHIKDVIFGSDAPGLLALSEYSEGVSTCTYYLEDGTPLPQFTLYGYKWYERVSVVGGLIEVLKLNMASYYDINTLECIFQTYLNYEID